ncbi:MAG TPA: nicotinate-nucleotide adenylyltransferase [Gemmataceae bacterium]|nr:nicotinate-nucleotide adenylyltransferase [Gemmataceae bacterium]
MRIGIFGGTFDPVHTGHLILAEQGREQARLDEVWFVPAAHPPHKNEPTLTRFEQRVEMLALAIAGNPAFRIDELEKERSAPSYTADTLAELRRRHPTHEFLLLIGSDALLDLPHWYQPLRVLEQAALLVMTRPGSTVLTVEQLRKCLHLPEQMPLRLEAIETPQIDISSRELRRRAAVGRSLRYFLPRSVECYIHDKTLYKFLE